MLSSIPRPALWLGFAGVLPFAAFAVQIATGWPMGPRATGPALYMMLCYGAVILSFLGGVHWGLAVAAGAPSDAARRYGVSILPSLVAWLGLWLSARNGVIVVALGILALFAYDRWTVQRGETPPWYEALRSFLTTAVLICLGAALLFGPF